MSQASVIMPTGGVVSGVTMAQDINAGFDAARTLWSGASAPSADTPEAGQLWYDTTNNALRIYDGANWLFIAYIDTTNHLVVPFVGSSIQNIASASTTTLGGSFAAAPAYVSISGTTTINSFGSAAIIGQVFFLTFQAALTLTYNATSMILPGQVNIGTAANDVAVFVYLGSGNWRCIVYQPVATLIGAISTINGAFITNNVISPAAISAQQNDYAPTGAASAVIWELTTTGADQTITGISASQVSGRRILIRNNNAAGGGRLLFPNQSTSSLAANRFKQPGLVQLNPQQQVEYIYDNAVTAWVPQNIAFGQPVQSNFKNLIAGNFAAPNFTYSGTQASQIKLTADAINLADADGNIQTLASVSVTADITTSGANGLDSGSVGANTWYSGWVIYNALTATAAALLSASTAAPTMPSGYTHKARVTWACTDGSNHFYRYLQKGRRAQFSIGNSTSNDANLPANVNAALGSGTFASPTLFGAAVVGAAGWCPTTAQSIIVVGSNRTGNSVAGNLLVAPSTKWSGTNNGPTGNNSLVWPVAISSINSAGEGRQAEFVIESTNIGYWSDGAAGIVEGLGWVDNI